LSITLFAAILQVDMNEKFYIHFFQGEIIFLLRVIKFSIWIWGRGREGEFEFLKKNLEINEENSYQIQNKTQKI